MSVLVLTRIRAGDDVTPVRPGPVREAPDGTDVEVVAAERHRPAAELLPVRIAREARETRRRGPRWGVGRGGCRSRKHIERRHRAEIGAVADWPCRAVARVVPAVP